MRRVPLVLAMVLAIMLLTTAAALAQDAEQTEATEKVVFCGQLSEADCALLNESQSALWNLTSGETARTVTVNIGGFPRLPADQPSLTISNRSMFVADPATIDEMLALQAAGPDALVDDPAAMQAALLLPLTIDSASTTTIVPTDELRALLSETLRRDLPAEFVYENRLIDGVLYINVSHFRQFFRDADSLGEWIGIDLMAIMPRVMETRVAEGDFDLDEVEESLMTPGQTMMAQPYLVMVEPGKEPMFNEFLEILPLRDAAIDDQIVAVYRMTMDVPAYTRSEAIVERFPGIAQSINNSVSQNVRSAATDRNIGGAIVQAVGSAALSNSNAMVLQGIGYDDAYLYAMEMEIGTQISGRSVDVYVQSGNANMNGIEAVPVPANAFIPPIRLILGLIETFSSSQ